MQNDLKQARVRRTNRPQGTILPFSFDWCADSVQQLVRRSLQTDDGQGLQITSVSTQTELSTPPQIGNTFAQRQPFHNWLSPAPAFSPYFETSGVVNGRLNPQHAALLVVHFDRVLFNPM